MSISLGAPDAWTPGQSVYTVPAGSKQKKSAVKASAAFGKVGKRVYPAQTNIMRCLPYNDFYTREVKSGKAPCTRQPPPQDCKGRNKYAQHFFELGLKQHTIHPRTRAAVANPWLNASSSVNMFEPSKLAHVFSFALHAGRTLQRLGCFVLKFRIQRAWQDLVVTLVTGLVSFVKIAERPRNQYIRVFQGGLSRGKP